MLTYTRVFTLIVFIYSHDVSRMLLEQNWIMCSFVYDLPCARSSIFSINILKSGLTATRNAKLYYFTEIQ